MIGTPSTIGQSRAVFLDRDGVLTVPIFRDGRSFAPRSPDALKFYPDAPQAVRNLKSAGFLTIVVTNQPDVGAGIVDQSVVAEMHAQLKQYIPVDDIEVCYETTSQATDRRKPGTGMLMSAAKRWNLNLKSSYMVGDRTSDVEAGVKAGCKSIFIDLGYFRENAPVGQVATVKSVMQAVDWILDDVGHR